MMDFLLWKKQINRNLLHKHKILFGGSIIVVGLLISFYIISLYYKIGSLEDNKKMSDLELNILRSSSDVTKSRVEENQKELVSLKKRFERIIDSSGDNFSNTFMAIPTDSPSQTEKSSTNTDYISKISPTFTPTPSETSNLSLGTVEIYSPSGKPISLYKDATTISPIIGSIPDKSITSSSKKVPGWYEIEIPNTDNYGWISEQYIRR